jgi:hypothetical protein
MNQVRYFELKFGLFNAQGERDLDNLDVTLTISHKDKRHPDN